MDKQPFRQHLRGWLFKPEPEAATGWVRPALLCAALLGLAAFLHFRSPGFYSAAQLLLMLPMLLLLVAGFRALGFRISEFRTLSARWYTIIMIFAYGVVGICTALSVGWAYTSNRKLAQLSPSAKTAITAQAAVIRSITPDEATQVALVQIAMDYCIEYDDSATVWGRDYLPSIDEMIQWRRAHGTPAPHGDCKARALYMSALANELGYIFRPVSSQPLEHAWLQVQLSNGVWVELGRETLRGFPKLWWSVYRFATFDRSISALKAAGKAFDLLDNNEAAAIALGYRYVGPDHRSAPNQTKIWSRPSTKEDRKPIQAVFPYGEPL